MKTKIIAVSKIEDEELLKELSSDSPEELVMYCARVSSPDQTSGNPKLLDYCTRKAHWSIFEQATMTVEIHTSRAISAQILRHRSFSFQEFSQRYAKVVDFELYEARRQDTKNRQNSIDDMSEEDQEFFRYAQEFVQSTARKLYEESLKRGIAKEQARFLLPIGASTKLYMTGSIRSWIHYLTIRCGPETQKEHRDIAASIKKHFVDKFPVISEALKWS